MSLNSTVGQATNVLSNAVVSSFPYVSSNYVISFAKHVDVEFEFATFTGGSSPTVQCNLQAINPVSGTVIRTFNGAILSAAGHDYISVDALMLGDTISLTIVVTGSPTNITGTYARFIPK